MPARRVVEHHDSRVLRLGKQQSNNRGRRRRTSAETRRWFKWPSIAEAAAIEHVEVEEERFSKGKPFNLNTRLRCFFFLIIIIIIIASVPYFQTEIITL